MRTIVRWCAFGLLASWLAACGDDSPVSGASSPDAVTEVDVALEDTTAGLDEQDTREITDSPDTQDSPDTPEADATTDVAADVAGDVTSPTCPAGMDCDDGDPCTIDACLPAAGCTHTLASGCTPTCGDGLCSGEETALTCTVDCGFLLNRYAGTCPTPNSWADCPDGYVCVARNAVAGGNICVADFENWQPIPDSHPASDFSEFADYVVDNKTNLFWQKKSMNWTSSLPPCVTETAGGFNDWRLPTEGELLSLVDYNAHTPATSAPGLLLPAPATFVVIMKRFASATPAVDPKHLKKWYWGTDLSFDGGAGPAWSTIPSGFIRCVRSVAAPVAGSGGRFAVENSGQTFLDRMTGLHWQRGQGKVATWQTAKDWCDGNLGGLPGSGWRLPTEGEFRQLANRQGNLQWGAVFGILPPSSWWSWGGWTSAVLWSWKYDWTGTVIVWTFGESAWLVNTWPAQENYAMSTGNPSIATCVRQ